MSPVKHPAAVALGRLGGLASARIVTAAKQAAARRNGRLGGRPPHITHTASGGQRPDNGRTTPDKPAGFIKKPNKRGADNF